MWTSYALQFLKGDLMAYTNSILNQAFDNQALKAALGQTFASANAAETVLELTRATGNRGTLFPVDAPICLFMMSGVEMRAVHALISPFCSLLWSIKAITKIAMTHGRYALRTGCDVCAICCVSCFFVGCR